MRVGEGGQLDRTMLKQKIIVEQSVAGKPPYVDNAKGVAISELTSFLKDQDLADKDLEFIRDIWQTVVHDDVVSVHKLARQEGKTVDTIRKRLEKYAEYGVFSRHEMRYASANRPAIHYRFECKRLQREILPKYVGAATINGRLMLDNLQDQLADARIDDLICTVLFAALPCRRIRVIPPNGLRTTINWFEQQVLTRTLVSSGKQIACVADLRFYIACLSLCFEIVQNCLVNSNPVDNSFAIDIGDINKFIGRDNDGGNINAVKSALSRLGFTDVEVPDLPASAIQKFGFESGSMVIRPLSNVAFFNEGKSSVHQRHYVVFQLPPTVFQSMLRERYLFIVNPKILTVKHPLLLSFHLWCRRRLGHQANTFVTTLARLNRDICPTLTFAEFQEDLVEALNGHLKSQTGISNESWQVQSDGNQLLSCLLVLYGYEIKSTDGRAVYVKTCQFDPYVGHASKRQQVLRSSAKALQAKQYEMLEGDA